MPDPKKDEGPKQADLNDPKISEERRKAAGKTGVINTAGGAADSGAEMLSAKEIEPLVGELEPGDIGYVPLDDVGTPTGPALSLMPEDGTRVAPVLAQAPRTYDELTTPAGAPLTTMMNPAHSFFDQGLHDRLISYERPNQLPENLAQPGVKQSGVNEGKMPPPPKNPPASPTP